MKVEIRLNLLINYQILTWNIQGGQSLASSPHPGKIILLPVSFYANQVEYEAQVM